MEGSIYTNLALIFIGEIISELLGGALLQIFLAKTILIFMFSLCFILCIVLIFFAYIPLLRVIILFINSFAFSMAFVVVWAHTNESYESKIKASAYGLLMNFGCLAVSLIGPVLELFPNPFYFFAIFSCIPIFVCFYI